MTQRYGIDTSVLVRLITSLPEAEFRRCQAELTRMVEQERAELFASNQVIGEAYIAVQHHYGVSKGDALVALTGALTSGFVAPSERTTGAECTPRDRRSGTNRQADRRRLLPNSIGNADPGPENGSPAGSQTIVRNYPPKSPLP